MTLPSFIALKSCNMNKYLRYTNEDPQLHGFLQFSGTKVLSPFTKFNVEKANSGNGSLVHIRCCYNNKYWRRLSQNYWWIVAGADEPEEDPSKWSCTLFEPFVDSHAKTVQFLHVQLAHYIYMVYKDYSSPQVFCLFAGSTPINDVFKFIDLESLFPLPNHVAFKDDNGDYVRACNLKDGQHNNLRLQFAPSTKSDPEVANQVFTNDDGSVCLKSDIVGKYWRREKTNNWILADSSNKGPDTLFWPVRLQNNTVALLDNFFAIHTPEEIINSLAALSTNSKEAYPKVEELVRFRKIHHVIFGIIDARIYGLSDVTKATGEAYNRTQELQTMEVQLSYEEIRSSTWNSSVSLKVYSDTNIETGVPVIYEGRIRIPFQFNEAYRWGSTMETKIPNTTQKMVRVPPMNKARVSLLATNGSCDVPFSYTQDDTLTNGQPVNYAMDDGIYTVTNCFNFRFVVELIPIVL